MTYQAAIFDLDGTLIDSLADLGDAVNRVLARRGFATHPGDAYRMFVGDGAAVLMRRALPPEARDAATHQECLQAFLQDYGRNWNVKTRPYPGIGPLLDELAGRGLKLAVFSNKPDFATQDCVAALLPSWSFDMVLGQREGRPPKPDPAGALDIARHLEVAPGQTMFVGDSAVDVRTALAAGMLSVGACWGFRGSGELRAAGARVLIEHPAELLQILD